MSDDAERVKQTAIALCRAAAETLMTFHLRYGGVLLARTWCFVPACWMGRASGPFVCSNLILVVPQRAKTSWISVSLPITVAFIVHRAFSENIAWDAVDSSPRVTRAVLRFCWTSRIFAGAFAAHLISGGSRKACSAWLNSADMTLFCVVCSTCGRYAQPIYRALRLPSLAGCTRGILQISRFLDLFSRTALASALARMARVDVASAIICCKRLAYRVPGDIGGGSGGRYRRCGGDASRYRKRK